MRSLKSGITLVCFREAYTHDEMNASPEPLLTMNLKQTQSFRSEIHIKKMLQGMTFAQEQSFLSSSSLQMDTTLVINYICRLRI